MRSVIGWVHSNWAPESKKRHCLQQCNWNWHLGHVPLGSNPGVRTAPQLPPHSARDGADHARSAGAELIGAARAAGGRLAVVRFVLFIAFFRVAVTAVTVLSIHKYLRPPVSTDCHNYNPYSCAVALANLACIQSDCYTRPDRAIIPKSLLAEMRMSNEREMGHLCLWRSGSSKS